MGPCTKPHCLHGAGLLPEDEGPFSNGAKTLCAYGGLDLKLWVLLVEWGLEATAHLLPAWVNVLLNPAPMTYYLGI